jgi:hypothetical protein
MLNAQRGGGARGRGLRLGGGERGGGGHDWGGGHEQGGAGTTAAAGGVAGTPAATLAGVPWSKVGPGWELAEYTAGPAGKADPVTLYLISPAGIRYAMHTWGAHATVPDLIAWSGDKTRALLGLTGSKYEQLTLATGKLTTGKLAGRAQPMGYTLPGGQTILGVTEASRGGLPATVARYSLAGKLLRVLTRGVNENTAVYTANGAALAVSGSKGLELVSNAGGVIRSLPVPGTDAPLGCTPSRWWNATTVLAQCVGNGARGRDWRGGVQQHRERARLLAHPRGRRAAPGTVL